MVFQRPTGESAAVVGSVVPRTSASARTIESRFMVATPFEGSGLSSSSSIAARASEMRHVGLHGLLERESGPATKRLAPYGAALEVAHGAVHPVARIGVNGQLAFHPELLDHLVGETFRKLVRLVHRPEFRHDEMRVHVMETPGADRAKMMDADHALPDVRAEDLDQAIQQRGILLVQQSAGRVADQSDAGPH